MESSLVEAVVVPTVMSYDAITISRNIVSTTGMRYYGIITGSSSVCNTSNRLKYSYHG